MYCATLDISQLVCLLSQQPWKENHSLQLHEEAHYNGFLFFKENNGTVVGVVRQHTQNSFFSLLTLLPLGGEKQSICYTATGRYYFMFFLIMHSSGKGVCWNLLKHENMMSIGIFVGSTNHQLWYDVMGTKTEPAALQQPLETWGPQHSLENTAFFSSPLPQGKLSRKSCFCNSSYTLKDPNSKSSSG